MATSKRKAHKRHYKLEVLLGDPGLPNPTFDVSIQKKYFRTPRQLERKMIREICKAVSLDERKVPTLKLSQDIEGPEFERFLVTDPESNPKAILTRYRKEG